MFLFYWVLFFHFSSEMWEFSQSENYTEEGRLLRLCGLTLCGFITRAQCTNRATGCM